MRDGSAGFLCLNWVMHSRAQLAVSYGGDVGWTERFKGVGGFWLLAGYVGLVRQALVNHGDGSMVSILS